MGRKRSQGIDELLADPIVRKLMQADRVDRRELADLLQDAGDKLEVDCDDPARAPASAGSPGENPRYRRGVGVMLIDEKRRVFVGRRIDALGPAWQMPQGGIRPGEDLRSAAFRELREEIGADKALVLAESRNWLRYDFPPDVREKLNDKRLLGQEQKWFLMKFEGKDADISVATAKPEFLDWKWVPIRALPEVIVPFKRALYVDLISEFKDVLRASRKPPRH